MKKVCVAISVTQKISLQREIVSLKQALKIFQNYPIIFICPQHFDEALLDEYMHLHPDISFKKFDSRYSGSSMVNSLLLTELFFYESFDYEYMMTHHLDAYAFRDELEYWCNQGFDFIGAPWAFIENGKLGFHQNTGNSGFCLKNIEKIRQVMLQKITFRNALKLKKMSNKYLMEKKEYGFFKNFSNYLKFYLKFAFKKPAFYEVSQYLFRLDIPEEDSIFAFAFPKIFMDFKVAKANEAIPFAFEACPREIYEINGRKLPFGCHAYHRFAPDFWQKFIPFSN